MIDDIGKIISYIAFLLLSAYILYLFIEKIIECKKRKLNRKLLEEKENGRIMRNRDKIIPPSIIKIGNRTIDLDAINDMYYNKFDIDPSIRVLIGTVEIPFYLSEMEFITTYDEYMQMHDYSILYPDLKFERIRPLESQYSKVREFEEFYNVLLKWKALRKRYLDNKEKISYKEYIFPTMIKNINFIKADDKSKSIYQDGIKFCMNSIYGVCGGFGGRSIYSKCLSKEIKYIEDIRKKRKE